MTAPARLAAAMAAAFLMLIVLISAAASAVTAAVTSPLAGLWHAVTGDPGKTQTMFGASDYMNLIATAEHDAPSPQAAAAIAFAAAQIGRPYIWGGTGTNNPDAGYDCSGLTQAAYKYARVDIPRVATAQYEAGSKVELQSLEPGDLAFYGDPSFAHHVAIYLGTVHGIPAVLNAPAPGEVVRLDPLTAGGDLFAATRPAPPVTDLHTPSLTNPHTIPLTPAPS
ncbi:C40 family peptidase [Catenulispora pinisilvae]|uniref:C40 family peptidase n=1 Tax=Catenulispora pinisilvae TaxID=2705253 RepID=UPI00189280FC|nr:C40 family peptidase [Catenulispora pinisilvae]